MLGEIGGVWHRGRQSPRKDLILCAVASIGVGLMLGFLARWLFSGAVVGGLQEIERERDWDAYGRSGIGFRSQLTYGGFVAAFLATCSGLLGLTCLAAAALHREPAPPERTISARRDG
ncbi:MAG: hypothetical protein H6811_01260 [Phycisphaeraceae bacterium]|nr:hypothetical protein [Phycisphaeraceae bacterium]